MKNILSFYLFLTIGIPLVRSQTPDVAISYVLREIQIQLAKEYNKELSKSLPKFTEYSIENTVFHKATKTGSNRPSSFFYTFPNNPCITKWGPLKLSRCRMKIALLRRADRLARAIPLTPTTYSSTSAVKNRIMVKTNSILKEINKELLNY